MTRRSAARHRATLGLIGAAVIVGWAAFMLLTSFAPGPWVARGAPCPRNWGWGPTWGIRASPLGRASATLGAGRVVACYGRPALRGREMLGGPSVPWGELWRTGANEPTTLHVDRPVRIGPTPVGPGSYALYTIPRPGEWTVILNRSSRQWGLESLYPAGEEMARWTAVTEELDEPVEQLTLRFVEVDDDRLDLVLEWQTARLSLPVSPHL